MGSCPPDSPASFCTSPEKVAAQQNVISPRDIRGSSVGLSFGAIEVPMDDYVTIEWHKDWMIR